MNQAEVHREAEQRRSDRKQGGQTDGLDDVRATGFAGCSDAHDHDARGDNNRSDVQKEPYEVGVRTDQRLEDEVCFHAMELTDAHNHQASSREAFEQPPAGVFHRHVTPSKVEKADAKKEDESEDRSDHPCQHHGCGKPNIRQQENGCFGPLTHPSKMESECTVHGAVWQSDEHNAGQSQQVQSAQRRSDIEWGHATTLRGRWNISFETPRMNGHFGIVIITFRRSRHVAWPLMKRMNSSPVSPEAILENIEGP